MIKDDQPLSILIIEDNPGDFLLISEYLFEKFSAIQLTHKETFETAIGEPKCFEGIDLILLDLGLPDLSGEELVCKIQEHSCGTPIVVLTNYSHIALARNVLSKGASDFLIKDETNPEIIYKSIVYAMERKSYITQLSKNEKVYQDLFDFSPQPMWIYDPETLSFLNVNRAAIAKYGYTLEEFQNMTIRDIRPKDQIEILEKSLNTTRNGNYAGTFQHTLKSGEGVIVQIYSSDIEYEGKILRLVLASDITEKQEYVNTIESQNKMLREIAWTQSHVVRAPLSRLLGIINLLQLDPSYSQEMLFLLDQIKESGDELDEIIKNIIAKTRSLNLKDF